METKPGVLIIEGPAAAEGEGISIVIVLEQIERIRSGALQIADAAEILGGYNPTTAQIRQWWREYQRKRS